MLLAVLLAGVLLVRRAVRGRGNRLATSEVDVDPASVFLGGILETEFTADALNARLDLLHMVRRVVSLTNDPGGSSVPVRGSQPRKRETGKHTHANDFVHVPWRI